MPGAIDWSIPANVIEEVFKDWAERRGRLIAEINDDPGDADPVPVSMDWSKVKWVTGAHVEVSAAATASLRERAGLSCPTEIGDEDVEAVGRVGRY